jgi:hypothetical protein
MSMPFLIFTCTACDYKGNSTVLWGRFDYEDQGQRVPIKRMGPFGRWRLPRTIAALILINMYKDILRNTPAALLQSVSWPAGAPRGRVSLPAGGMPPARQPRLRPWQRRRLRLPPPRSMLCGCASTDSSLTKPMRA